MRFRLKARTNFPLICGAGCLTVMAVSLAFSAQERLPLTLTLPTAVGGVTGFLYAQHTQETQIFRELFREFNKRYSRINERLNEIRGRPMDHQLTATDKDALCDYFNLCAEEFMYAQAGFLDPAVWDAWRNGMRYYARDPEIRALWQTELAQGSYYGFDLQLIVGAESR